MSLRKRRKNLDEEAPDRAAETTSADDPTTDPEHAPEDGDRAGDVETLDPLARAEAERDEMEARWKRAAADYQNLRRRMQSDLEAARDRARGEILYEVLTVLDYLDMALATECTTEEGRNLQMGVRMTRENVAALLDRFEVREIATDGAFDPDVHQAMATVETDEHAPGTIVEVQRRGWRLGEHVLRHAQVKVAAAPAASGGEAPDDRPATDEEE